MPKIDQIWKRKNCCTAPAPTSAVAMAVIHKVSRVRIAWSLTVVTRSISGDFFFFIEWGRHCIRRCLFCRTVQRLLFGRVRALQENLHRIKMKFVQKNTCFKLGSQLFRLPTYDEHKSDPPSKAVEKFWLLGVLA